MRININNKAGIPLKLLVNVYGKYCNDRDDGETFYEGKIDYMLFEYENIKYKLIIKYNKDSITLATERLDIYPKKISKKGLRFPKLK